MSSTLYLTARDQEILQTLVQKVRLFGLRQIAAHWWYGDMANARRRLKSLLSARLVQRLTVHARTLPPIEQPVAIWQPGDPVPDFNQIAYQLQSRWQRRAVRSSTAFIATERVAQLYGGRCRGELKNPLQATHDLGVAAIWLWLDRHAPSIANAWRSEDMLAHTRRGEKLPDAFLVGDMGAVERVVEFGGNYGADRVEAFHDDCRQRDLPYQIW